ncbi:BTAD domain-containing putative transcriptional regulator [Streptomyces sp. NPDC053493]|uniref:BTAD domain-containing putative transcriptional regulator n=1 Tax=Streptomyces sp. NPDC053493 TaxID=3365705 RepID=UPI0037CF083C
MRFGILGQTRAWDHHGTEIPLGGPARRALLALLLARPGEPVSADLLAEEIDPDGPLSDHAVQSQVSRLRTALRAAADTAPGPAAMIERAGDGYRIDVPADAVDACRFERLTARGRAALHRGDGTEDAERAAALLREALELWRGPALDGVADRPSVQATAVRLEELRTGALEDRYEAALRLGEHRAAVPELRELVSRHPLRERPAGLLMRALSADGGQAEALLVYERTRRRLAEELGADPSPELTALHRELLQHDPTPAPAAPPAPLTSFVGRTAEVDEVAGLLRVARLVTLTGPGGVGKTRLAAEVAGTLNDELCFVELAPLRDGDGLPQALLNALGLRETGLQAAGAARAPLDRLITALTDRTLLLVLDNCEHVVDEAAALAARLLAACPRLRVLATSREPLGVIGEHLCPVGPLDDDAAVRLFTDRAAAVRRGPAPDPRLVRRVCAAVDGLPLAIELTAARLRTLDIDDLANRLDDLLGMAARGNRTADERHRTLRSVVAWGWDLLSEPERRAARRFAVFAGGATAEAAARVCETDGETLESLADKSFIRTGGGRYRMLETIRAYAAEQLAAAGEEETTGRAHALDLLHRFRTADPFLRGTAQLDWLPALSAEHDNLLAALRWAVATRAADTGRRLLACAATSLWIQGRASAVAPHASALLDATDVGRSARLPSADGEEYAVCVLLAAGDGPTGRAVWEAHRDAAGRALAEAWAGGERVGSLPAALLLWMMRNAGQDAEPAQVRAAFDVVAAQRTSPEPWARAVARYVSAFGALGDGDTATAERALDEAVEGFRALGDRWGTALALDALAGLAGGRGDRARAVALTEQALALTEQLGALEDSADLLVNRGDQLAADDRPAARADYTRAAELAASAGSADRLAAALRGQGDLALAEGDLTAAERLYTEGLERIDRHWIKSLGNQVRTLAGLGRVAAARGDHTTAQTRYAEAVRAASGLGPAAAELLRLFGLPEALAGAVSER